MADAPLSQEEQNYIRMNLLLTGISSRGVRTLFDQEFAPPCLKASINQEFNKLKGLTNKRIINQSQWSLLFPRHPDVPDSKTFDVTLMITLLKHLTSIGGSDILPASTDTTSGADLARIKYYRNYLAHLNDCKVDTTFFKTAWIDITGAIKRLGGNEMKKECDYLKNKHLDQSSQEIKELKKSLESLKQDTVPWNVRVQINNILEKWKEKDKLFVTTRAAKHVLKSLKENSSVTITASSGVGKTVTLQHVALQMCTDGYDILLITNPGEIVTFYNPNKKTLFVIDDLCGNFSLNMSDIKIWEPVIERIKVLLTDNQTKIIVACRLQVYQDDKFDTLSVFKSCVCNLLSESMCLLKSEKQSIAKMYLEDKASEITDFYDLYDCFPLLCQLYHTNPVVDIKGFFQNPFSVFEKQVEELNKNNFVGKYCALALCVVFNNKVSEEILTEEIDETTRKIIENTCESCKLDRGTPRLILKDEFDSLLYTFLKKEEKMNEATENVTPLRGKQYFYTTIHDKIFDILTHYFGRNIIYCLIKNAHSQLIRERFLLYRKDDTDQLITIVPTKYHQMYIQRMVDDWSQGKLHDVFNNINMKIAQFRLAFLYHLKKIDIFYQKKLAHTYDEITTLQSRNKKGLVCDTVLLHCCLIGDIEMIKWCCNHGVDVNQSDFKGWSPLMYACRHNHREAVIILIEQGADYNKCNKLMQSPIMIACMRGHKDIIKTLLDKGADCYKCDFFKTSPLEISIKNGHTEITMMLIENITEKDKGKKCALALCVVFNNKVNEEMLTEEIDDGTRVTIENICEACELTKGTSRLLLKAELDSLIPVVLTTTDESIGKFEFKPFKKPFSTFYKTKDDKIFDSLVNLFVQKSKLIDCLIKNTDSHFIRDKFLLEKKDDMEQSITIVPSQYHRMYMQRMIDDWSAGKLYDVFNNINMKMHQFRQKFLSYLNTLEISYQEQLAHTCENKAVLMQSNNGMSTVCDTVVLYCCSIGDPTLIQWCFKNGVDVNNCSSCGQFPLIMASSCGSTEIVKMLLEKGADYNKCDIWGNSTLMLATLHGHTEIVRMLLDKGDDYAKWCRNGDSHVMTACKSGDIELVTMLLEKGADFSKCDDAGNSPLLMAAKLRLTEIIRILLDKGADFGQCDVNGQSPIIVASMQGQKEIVKILLEKGSDYNSCENSGNSALMIASSQGQTEIVKMMLDKGADCSRCNTFGQKPVMMACRNGHTETVKMMIYHGEHPNKSDDLGLIMIACEHGHTEIVMLLLEKGLEYDKCGTFGQSALMMACRYGHTKIVRVLLEKGADYNKCDMYGNSPLIMSCIYGHTKIVRMLLAIGADENKCDGNDQSPVMIASEHGHTEIVMMILDKGGNYDKCGSLGQSPLLMASRFGHRILLNKLLENGADYNKCDKWGQSPVLMSSKYGHTGIVKILLDIGADYNKCDINGDSPVTFAVQNRHTNIVRLLVDIGADYSKVYSTFEPPLLMACEYGHTELVRMLLDRGEDYNISNRYLESLVLLACKNGHTEVVRMLLDKGTDCNKCDLFGNIPLTLAYEKNHTEIVKMLIDKGAACNVVGNTLMTPVMMASTSGHTEILNMLLERGADYNMCDSQGNSPIMNACRCGHTEIVKLLLDKGADCNKFNMFGESPVATASRKGHHDIVDMINAQCQTKMEREIDLLYIRQ